MFGNYNPYYNYMQPQIPRVEPQFTQPQQPPQQAMFKQPVGLQGKSVDSLDVVKAMDIPLDGSVSYFPLLDGSAIITKQLQQDGTSRMIIYRPVENEKETPMPKYVTIEDMNAALKDVNSNEIKEIKDSIKTLKRQVRELSYDVKDKKEE